MNRYRHMCNNLDRDIKEAAHKIKEDLKLKQQFDINSEEFD